jgi:hypothetical protein
MDGRRLLLEGGSLVAALILGVSTVPAHAEPHCTDATLDGLYVFTARGFNIVGGVPQPKAIVELIRFNGHGTVDVPGGRASVNGTVFPTAGKGTYTTPTPVDKGCEATISFVDGPTHYLFIPPHADEIQVIQINSNTVFQGTATRVTHRPSLP